MGPANALVNAVVGSPLTPRPARWAVLRLYGLDIQTYAIAPRCFFGGNRITIGRRSFVNVGCLLDNVDQITIGENCFVGMGTTLVTGGHEIGPADARAGSLDAGPVTIGDGVWIGANVTVLPGVTIEPGCVIAAGAVVRERCHRNGLYAGVPATRRRDLSG